MKKSLIKRTTNQDLTRYTSPIYEAFETAMSTGTPPPTEILEAAAAWVRRYLRAGQKNAACAMQDRLEMWINRPGCPTM